MIQYNKEVEYDTWRIKDKRRNASGKGVLLGPSYERNIPVVTAKEVLDDKKDNNKNV